jgi:hypothetical protein
MQASIASTHWGPAYLSGAFAFANHWMSTSRMAAFGDSLSASFDAQTYGGRIESGYRLGTLASGLTPFAEVQALGFRTPNYAETDQTGGGFGLAVKGHTASDTRSELGARVDHVFAVSANTSLALLARLGWAHDWVSDPTLVAAFQTLLASVLSLSRGRNPYETLGSSPRKRSFGCRTALLLGPSSMVSSLPARRVTLEQSACGAAGSRQNCRFLSATSGRIFLLPESKTKKVDLSFRRRKIRSRGASTRPSLDVSLWPQAAMLSARQNVRTLRRCGRSSTTGIGGVERGIVNQGPT